MSRSALTEKASMRAILLAASTSNDARLFRNNVGVLQDRHGNYVAYGLCVGSHDLIGWHSVEVTPEMVGKRIAIFTAIETKRDGETASKTQTSFKEAVLKAGGISGVAHTVDDFRMIVDYWLRQLGAIK